MKYVFYTACRSLHVKIEPSQRYLTPDGKLYSQPSKVCSFVGGVYKTDNDAIAEKLRKSKNYGKLFKEIKAEELKQNIQERKGIALSTIFECDKCGAQFSNQKALSGHAKAHSKEPTKEEIEF